MSLGIGFSDSAVFLRGKLIVLAHVDDVIVTRTCQSRAGCKKNRAETRYDATGRQKVQSFRVV